jgi:hypothetical protein
MKLTKKPEEQVRLNVDHNKKIPYGKFQGRTAGWVLANEKRYCDWMDSEGLWEKWKLYKDKKEVKQKAEPREYKIAGEAYSEPPPWEDLPVTKKPQPFVAKDGTVYVGIKEAEVLPKENKWIKEATSLLGLLYLENISEPLKDLIKELLHMPVE